MKTKFVTTTAQKAWVRHSLFWGVSFYLIAWYFSVGFQPTRLDFLFGFVLHISLVTVVYLNLRLLIPKLLTKNKYLLYTMGVALSIVIGVALHSWLFQIISPFTATYGFYMVSFLDWQVITLLLSLYWLLSTLFNLSKAWWRNQRLEKENLRLSLHALQSQVNPHFLFNSLHSLYALALKNSAKTPELLLNLSDMLRYMLYQSQHETIPISAEINYLTHYVDFQKLRVEEHVSILYEVRGDHPSIAIAPLLLAPIVENAFKYGIGPGNSLVKILITLAPHRVTLETQNTVWNQQPTRQHEEGGIGLRNVIKRLGLLYPHNHSLDIQTSNDTYNTKLSVWNLTN